jgi:hypothetical protein
VTPAGTGRPSPAPPRPAQTDADACLAAARLLLTQVIAGARGTWPRACAWLIRLALEAELTRFWLRSCPPAAACRSHRAQFLLLPSYAEPCLARRAHQIWATLSHAGHHHAYELGLTATELSQLLDGTSDIITALRASGPQTSTQ